MKTYIFPITPVSKPRMTQSDKWKKRECTTEYWNFKDNLNLIANQLKFELPDNWFHIIFVLPFPLKAKQSFKDDNLYKSHCVKPDVDNCLKSIFDSLKTNDSYISDCRITKIYGDKGYIVINVYDGADMPLFVNTKSEQFRNYIAKILNGQK